MLRCSLCCCVLILVLARAAGAAPVPFDSARLVLQFGPLYGVQAPPAAQPGVSGTADVSYDVGGAITRIEFPASVFAVNATSIPFDSQTAMGFIPPIGGVQLTFANQAGVLSRVATAQGSRLQGQLPLAGVNKFCMFFVSCGAAPTHILTVPLSVVGKGGTAGQADIPSVFIVGGTWSTGTVTVDGPNQQTAMLDGAVQVGTTGATLVRLVTPIFLSTNTTGSYPTTRGLGVLSFALHPVPEPGVTALLGSAAAALLVVGWVRSR